MPETTVDKNSLAEPLRTLIVSRAGGDEILALASTDLTLDGIYGEQWLVGTAKEVLVCTVTGNDARVLSAHPLADIEKIETVNFVGSGAVELVPKEGTRRRLLVFTSARAGALSKAVGSIGIRIKGEDSADRPPEEKDRKCEHCGQTIPEGKEKCPRCTKRSRTMLRILGFTRPYAGTLTLVLLTMLTSTGFGLATPWVSKLFIDLILKPDPVSGTFVNAHWLPWASLALLVAHVGQLLCGGLQWWLSGSLGFKAVYDVRDMVYRKLQELSLSFFDKHQTGSIMARVNQDTGELQRFLVDFIPLTLESLFMLVGVGVFLLVLSWKLTLLVFLPITATVLFLTKVFPRLGTFFRRYFHRRARLSALVSDTISGMRVVKAFGQEDEEVRKFDERSGLYRDAGIDLVRRWAVYHPILHFFIMSGTILVWFVGGRQVVGGAMTLGSVVAYSGYLAMFYRPVFILTRLVEMIVNSLTAAERIFDVLDTEPEVRDLPDAQPMPDLQGAIEFRGVSFGYDQFKPVIKDFEVAIEPNEIIGLVGKSGAGKSTLINLMCRLYDVNKGSVLIDGVDVKKIRYADLRSRIGVVLQDTFLFNGTIYENIAYARENVTRAEVIEAAISANAHEFIIRKPDGYDTEVGERGNKLSGGEKQRVAIARAILRDPRILILDEATSSVDTETEKKIQQALENLMRGRTTIAIAHRLSTLRNCHRLLVLDDGRLAEQGTHQELMDKQGIFHNLQQMQKELAQIIAIDG